MLTGLLAGLLALLGLACLPPILGRWILARPDFLALPRDQRQRLYEGHWTAEGHRVAAQLIAERIATAGLL